MFMQRWFWKLALKYAIDFEVFFLLLSWLNFVNVRWKLKGIDFREIRIEKRRNRFKWQCWFKPTKTQTKHQPRFIRSKENHSVYQGFEIVVFYWRIKMKNWFSICLDFIVVTYVYVSCVHRITYGIDRIFVGLLAVTTWILGFLIHNFKVK